MKASSLITWGLADQIAISASNFMTMLIIARALSPNQFGVFSVYFIVLMLACTVQSSMISTPHNVIGAQLEGARYRDFTRSAALAQSLYSASVLVLIVLGIGLGFALGFSQDRNALSFLAVVIAYLWQEFFRRVLYTEDRELQAFLLDVLSYGGQALGLTGLWLLDRLDTVTAPLLTMALFTGTASLWGFFLTRVSFEGVISRTWVKDIWRLGGWIGGASIVGWFSTQIPVLAAGWVLGAGAIGLLRATEALLRPLGVLMSYLDTVLPIRFSRLLSFRSQAAMDNDFAKVASLFALLLAAACLVLASLGPMTMSLLFGEKYATHRWLPLAFGAVYFAMGMNKIFSARLRAMRKGDILFKISIGSLAATIITIWPLTDWAAIYGTVACVLLTYLVSLGAQVALSRGWVTET